VEYHQKVTQSAKIMILDDLGWF